MKSSRPCPACGGAAREVLHQHRFARIDGVSVVDGYAVVACRDCGMTFADGVPDQAAFDRYYRDASKYTHLRYAGAESPADAARLGVTADAIAALVANRSARILDLGCATGRLMLELRARGFTDVAGIDPSPAAVDAARRIHGVAAEVGTLATASSSDRMAEVVILVGVLEHVVDIGASLDQLCGIVEPGGAVYIEVPDVLGFANWPNAPFQEFSVEHINYFSAASLARALANHGFRLVWHERTTRQQDPATTVATLAAMATRDGARAPADTTPRDDASVAAIRRYIARSLRGDAHLRARLNDIARQHHRVAVWGAGTLTLRLLAAGFFDQMKLAAIADSNQRYQGRTVAGVLIVSPDTLSALGIPVIVSSWGGRTSMSDQLRNSNSHKVTTIEVFDELLSKNLSTN